MVAPKDAKKYQKSQKKRSRAKVAFRPKTADVTKMLENGSKDAFWPKICWKNTFGPKKALKRPKIAKEKRNFSNFSAPSRPPRPSKSAGKGKAQIFFKKSPFLKKQLGRFEQKLLPATLLSC